MTRGRFISLMKKRPRLSSGFSEKSLECFFQDVLGECNEKQHSDSQRFLGNERERIRAFQGLERQAQRKGFDLVAGVDEVGRGPLAGPLVAACVVFRKELPFIPCINDSKCLKECERETVFPWIEHAAEAIGLGIVEPLEIDRLNVHRASLEAMSRAVRGLKLMPDYLFVDGLFQVPSLPLPQKAVVKGDRLSFSVACASIIAKVTRDKIMNNLHRIYPCYGFSKNKGYPTLEHVQALREHGVSPIHRKSYGPVRKCLIDGEVTQ
jgi:ribonuclease HII